MYLVTHTLPGPDPAFVCTLCMYYEQACSQSFLKGGSKIKGGAN